MYLMEFDSFCLEMGLVDSANSFPLFMPLGVILKFIHLEPNFDKDLYIYINM